MKNQDELQTSDNKSAKLSKNKWLGNIPLDWNESKLKFVASIKLSNIDKKSVEGEQPVLLCNYVNVYYNEKITNSINFMEATATSYQVNTLSLKEGDVLITKDSETPDDIAVSTFIAETLPGVVCGYHLAHIRPKNSLLSGAFLNRAFQTQGIKDQFIVSANGVTRFGIGEASIKNALFPIPCLQEQQTIAQFLDHKTTMIDQYIANKQRQLELLDKLRTSIISKAVTQGLNPDVEMKDSGVEWLGKIPKIWNLTKVKFIVSLVTSGSRGWAEHYSENGAIFVRITNIQRNSIELDFTKIQKVTPPLGTEGTRTSLQKGDVLVSITADIGSVGVFPDDIGEAYVNQHTALVRPNTTKINPRWLAYCLFSSVGKAQFSMLLQGGTKDGLELGDIKNLFFPKPSLEEQHLIVDYLDKQIGHIDQTVTKLKYQITKMESYRTSLISEAVTGKIDVRDFKLSATEASTSQNSAKQLKVAAIPS